MSHTRFAIDPPTPSTGAGMKLHIGSGLLQDEADTLQLDDEAAIAVLRSDTLTKAHRQGRGMDDGRDGDAGFFRQGKTASRRHGKHYSTGHSHHGHRS
jgi:hypothetical protein